MVAAEQFLTSGIGVKVAGIVIVVVLEGIRRWLRSSTVNPVPTPAPTTIITNHHHVTNITQVINQLVDRPATKKKP